MITLTLPSHLADFDREQGVKISHTTVSLDANSWEAVAREIRARYPRLAGQVLTQTNTLAPGFALVFNDEIVQRDYAASALRNGDQLCIIATLAGG